MKEATWPTFIAAPFIWPSTSKICSAASIWRRTAASRATLLGAGQVGGLGRVAARRLAAGQPADLGRPPPASGGEVVGHAVQGTHRLCAPCDSSTTPPTRARAPACCATAASSRSATRRPAGCRRCSRRARSASVGAGRTRSRDVELLPPIERPGKLHLHRPQLPRARGGERRARRPRRRPSSPSSRPRCGPHGATVELPRWSSKVDYEAEVAFVIGERCKDVPAEERARARRRLHAAERPVRARLPVQDAAVDARQDLRRLRAVRAGAGHARRGRPARRDRHRARPQRRAHAGELDREPRPLDPGAGRVPVDADDARAGRRGRHRHARGGRQPARPEGVAEAGDEVVVSSPQLGELRTTLA